MPTPKPPPRMLKLGDSGPDVLAWERFLARNELLTIDPDFFFGESTRKATVAFQKKQKLEVDGKVGKGTRSAAKALGYDHEQASYWPPRPKFDPVETNAQRELAFGKFSYRARPTEANPEAIEILGTWREDNIAVVEVPELAGTPFGWGGSSDGKTRFHRRGAEQLKALFKAWAAAGLLDRIKTYDGAFNPRFQRGSKKRLSAHAWGAAFDVNAAWNGLAEPPAGIGDEGCLLELVPLANKHGFYWGGHFSGRLDGMHFEIARFL